MEPEFWHRRWADSEIGFHEGEVNGLLAAHFGALSLAEGSRIFVPLCGKSVDITWLLSQGYQVIGCELSELAVRQYFQEQDLLPDVQTVGAHQCFQVGQLQIWQGDFFTLPPSLIGPVDALYDRAALVALPPALRNRYAQRLAALACPQLLITLVYDQALMPGPPFSVDAAGIRAAYGQSVQLLPLATREVPGGLKGLVAAREMAWLLRPEAGL